ncbi:arylsulfatase [Algisphaera agarilytica]|uniref:Arylsulfatase A-like enzyme n=1 Tax=Algisphaera agarilytica TaxID=1385975 RepID=A0A7X0H8L6_9BACT|nr:arylsulfatase [Algisphaera agarilytica]MBB6431246.1 arylsulfatase A-like enzyme [Algisphaera agarilytica]
MSAQPNTPPQAPATQRPNIVWVITDDQGYGDLSCTSNPVVKTPQIDRFYEDAIRLTDFHVGPTCAPTRAGLLTGLYSGSTGVWHTIGGRSIIRQSITMLPEVLRDGGYATAMFGKWHLGDNYPYRPHDRGFETVIHHPAGGIGQQPDFWGNDYFDDTYLVNNEPRKFEGYCTDVWFDQAGKFIEDHVTNNSEEPFFCYIAPNAPHGPYNVPPGYADPYAGKVPDHVARFYGMITNIDENFAQLRELLQRLAIEDNTIVIFMTDNGSSCPMIDRKTGAPEPGFNGGLRGGKGSPYDGGHRVPVFIRWPDGGLTGGRDVEALTANIDVMPTLLDLCGVEASRPLDMDGHSLRGLLYGNVKLEDVESRVVVTDSQRVLEPVKWKDSAVMTRRWRLIQGDKLFDILEDRAQQNNLAAEFPEVVEQLRQEYEAWWAHVYAGSEKPIPLPVGDPEGPKTVQLNSHDWRYADSQNDVVWNQKQVRQGVAYTGFWEVDVVTAGRYQVELRRWPREDREHIAPPGDPGNEPLVWNKSDIDPSYLDWYSGDTPLDIAQASLVVGEQQLTQAVTDKQGISVFEIDLPEGFTHMRAEFELAGGESLGAYYVYVTRQSDAGK